MSDAWQTHGSLGRQQAAIIFRELWLQVGEEHAGFARETRGRANSRAEEMDSQGYEDRTGAPGHKDRGQHAWKPHVEIFGTALASVHVMTVYSATNAVASGRPEGKVCLAVLW